MVDLYQGVGWGTGGGYYFFSSVEHDSCCVCFFVYYLFSLSLVPLTRSYWGIEIVVPVM